MTYDYKSKKIVAVISNSLESWQTMNVIGHLAVSLGANKDSQLMGRNVLIDKSGIEHKGIARFGFIVKKGETKGLSLLVTEARKNKDLTIIDFPREMLDTRHDDELVQSLQNRQESELEYLGVLLYGDLEKVNSLTRNFSLWN